MRRVFHAFATALFFFSVTPVSSQALQRLEIAVEDIGEWTSFIRQWQSQKKPFLKVRMNQIPAVIKFHGSYHTRKAAEKPSFRLNWKNQNGTSRTSILKAEYFDPSRLREWLGLKMFAAAGIISPEAEFVKFIVDGKLLGVYLLISPVDSEYIRGLTGEISSKEALLYYGDPPSEKGALKPDFLPLERSELYKSVYTPVMTEADPYAAELDKLMIMLGGSPFDIKNLAPHADLGQWSRWFAVSGIMENWDSPWHRRGNNYTLYRPPGGRWQILPWDPDHIFEGRGLFFPVSKVNGLKALSASALFRKKIQFETWRLSHGSLSSKKVLTWVKEGVESLAPAIYAGEEEGLGRQKWDKAINSLRKSVLARYSRIAAICQREKCGDTTLLRFITDNEGSPVMW